MKRIVIGGSIVFLGGILPLYSAMFADRSAFQTGLSDYQGLPRTASDITIYQNNSISGVFVADFGISEHDFVAFATEQHWDLQTIPNLATVFQAKAFHEGHPNRKKEIVDGVFYSKLIGNSGGIAAAYDRKDGRGYIYRSSR